MVISKSRMMKKLPKYGLLIFLFSQACKEKYIAKLDEPEKILVVEGRITDEPGPQTITLTNAVPFNKDQAFPEMGAIVSVFDEAKNSYNFRETFPGVYVSNHTLFHPTPSKTYTLLIKTKEGKSYISTAQTLQPQGSIDTIYSSFITKTFQVDVNNTTVFTKEAGIEFLTTMNLSDDKSPYYRFSNSLLIEYVARPDTTKLPYYCSYTYSSNDFLNLFSQVNNSQKAEHVMGFVPTDSAYYALVTEKIPVNPPGNFYMIYKKIHSFMISFKQFHINKDVYDYYNAMNIQLQAQQRIFDPIAYQFRGNMVCIDVPNEVVLGIFEVASVRMRTFIFNPYLSRTSLLLNEIPPVNIDSLSQSDCLRNTFPSFWTVPLDGLIN
jgi:hypothetical protein